jgi:hypothetical protein
MAGFIEADDGSALSYMGAVRVQYTEKVLSIVEESGRGVI